jgi:flagellar motility protein MotE (MotC chaperone)
VNEHHNSRAPEPASEAGQAWVYNYFNYFTEIEEHFQRARGTGLFLLSPLDWALIDTWKNAGVPLQAVMRGIDSAFEKWRGRKTKTRMVNSLAFCAQAVLTEAQIMAAAGAGRAASRREAAPPFSLEELHRYLRASAAALPAGYAEIAEALERLAAEVDKHYADLEALEQRLTVLEEKAIAMARTRQSEEQLLEARRELDRQLRPYRGKMTADQLALLEKRYLERDLLEDAGLPRLSLFYMR